MMNQSNFEIITELLNELQQEYDSLQKTIDEYFVKIKEIEYFIQFFLDKEDQDFKIFSPKNVEDIYGNEISKANADKDKVQQKLNETLHQQNLLRSKIQRLSQIIENEKSFHEDTCARQQNLTILSIQEEDRQRIARDLHDASLQNLTHLIHKIELSSMFIDQDPLRAKLELAVISKNLKDVIEDIRNTIFDLRPMSFDDLGLKDTFLQLLQKVNVNNEYKITKEIDDVSCENNLILASIFRIAQECLINTIKHANASEISFYCKQINTLCVIDIKDNGKGFTMDEIACKQRDRHFGITLIKERVNLLGGKISIDSVKEKGTHIHIEIPLA